MMKIKVINEEKNFYKEENMQQELKINELSKEINLLKEKNNEYLNKLSDELISEKKKNKKIEEKLSSILNDKTTEFESLQKKYNINKNNYEKKLKEISGIKDKMKKELKVKEDQLLVMKMNNDKITSLYEQKNKFLEKEVSSWKDKYHNALIETKNKENDLNKENIKLKEQYKLLLKNSEKNNSDIVLYEKNSNNHDENNNSKKSLNELVKKQLKENKYKNKIILENIIKIKNIEGLKKKNSQSNGERKKNHKDFSVKDTKTKLSADVKETKVRNIEEELIDLNEYKDNINTLKDFKCKFCLKTFSFPEYKEHFNICSKNPMNENNNKSNSNNVTHNNIIINNSGNSGKSRRNNNTNSNSNNRRSNYSTNRVKNSNLMNNDNKNQNININLNNINDDFNNTKNINYKINNGILNENNFNNINIKINNQNININRNLININNIKKITNNIHLNNYIKNSKNLSINNIHGNITSNVSFNHINHVNRSSYSNSNINSNNIRNNYSNSSLPNFNPKNLKTKIIKGRIRKDKAGKPYLEYIIEMNYLSQKWLINKRFNQFINFFKNLKALSNQIGKQLPQSANIFNNIGTVFSGLSHENKIIQLEKFLKDISEAERFNSSQLYQNFFEIEQLFKQYTGSRNSAILNNETNNKTSHNRNTNDKTLGNNYISKNNNNSYIYHQRNSGGNSNLSYHDKKEKGGKDISAPKGTRKMGNYIKTKFNNNFYDEKITNNNEIKSLKVQIRNKNS